MVSNILQLKFDCTLHTPVPYSQFPIDKTRDQGVDLLSRCGIPPQEDLCNVIPALEIEILQDTVIQREETPSPLLEMYGSHNLS